MPKETVVLEFKSVSPFFELCRDGIKNWDARLVDPDDERFYKLAIWKLTDRDHLLWVKFTNPLTKEHYTREVLDLEPIREMSYHSINRVPSAVPLLVKPGHLWVMMYLGGKIG